MGKFRERVKSLLTALPRVAPPAFDLRVAISDEDRDEARSAGAKTRADEDAWLAREGTRACPPVTGARGYCVFIGPETMRVSSAEQSAVRPSDNV